MSTDDNAVISVKNLSKIYKLGLINHGTLYRDMQSWWAKFKNRPDPNSQLRNSHFNDEQKDRMEGGEFKALDNISFDVNKGDILGVIGNNGAGKSTLLKVLSRITSPTEGTIGINGKLGSLLEVGTGFHPELTGRENVFLNGAILGMRRSEIQKKFDEIVEFAEIDQFIDTPVKRYSSGMYVRLAFSVAAHLESDILLVDEVLAVGDANFQKKCLGKMGSVSSSGKTIIFVSHNMTAIQNLCTKAMVLDRGKKVFFGDVKSSLDQYLSKVVQSNFTGLNFKNRSGNMKATIENVEFTDFNGNSVLLIKSGMDIAINILIKRHANRVINSVMAFGITTLSGDGVMHFSTETSGLEIESLDEELTLICKIPKLPLRGGLYSLNLFLKSNGDINDYIIDAFRFEIVDGDFYGTGKLTSEGYPFYLPTYSWDLD